MPASTILETRPTTDVGNLMQTERDCSYYLEMMQGVRTFLRPIGKSLVHVHQCLLGRQSFCWTGSEFRFWIWERPTYRLFINNRKGICFEVPDAATRDQALDALEQYRQDIQMSGSLLPGSESLRLEYQGRDAIKGHELEIGAYPDDKLRKFVLAFCDGQVWTDKQCQGADVGIVFMPLAFGGISPPDDVMDEAEKKLPEYPGDEPGYPPRPAAPKEPELPPTPKRPPAPKWVQEDPEKVADIKHKIKWQAANKADLDTYRTYIETQNRMLQDSYDVTLDGWEQGCEEVWAKQEVLERKYETAFEDFEKNAEAEWKAKCKEVGVAHKEWMAITERHETARLGLFKQYTENLGLIWEYMDKAGPRAINGCPLFHSCRLMNKDDFRRASRAIDRESKRRKSFKI